MHDLSIVLGEPDSLKATVCTETVKGTEWVLNNIHLGNFDGRCVIIERNLVPYFMVEIGKANLTYKLT